MCPATDDNAAQGDLDQPECSDYLLTVPKANETTVKNNYGKSDSNRKSKRGRREDNHGDQLMRLSGKQGKKCTVGRLRPTRERDNRHGN